MIHIPNPNKALLQALAEAGALPPAQLPTTIKPAEQRRKPKRRKRTTKPQTPPIEYSTFGNSWGWIVTLAILALPIIAMIFGNR